MSIAKQPLLFSNPLLASFPQSNICTMHFDAIQCDAMRCDVIHLQDSVFQRLGYIFIHSELLIQKPEKLLTMCLLLVYKPCSNAHWPFRQKHIQIFRHTKTCTHFRIFIVAFGILLLLYHHFLVDAIVFFMFSCVCVCFIFCTHACAIFLVVVFFSAFSKHRSWWEILPIEFTCQVDEKLLASSHQFFLPFSIWYFRWLLLPSLHHYHCSYIHYLRNGNDTRF